MRSALAAIGIAFVVVAARPATDIPHYDDYRGVLMAFVDAKGLVDYASLREQRGDLDDFVHYLEQLNPETYEAWSDADKIAFWINAYNALTLRAIVYNPMESIAEPNLSYPRRSIRQIPGVWDFARVNVMGESITLGYIETKYLRRDFHEPRFHMALVCAAMSCPKLRNEPYEGAKLKAQLDDQMRTFLSDPRHFRIDRSKGTVRVSEIFRWYAPDFAPVNTPKADLERKALVTATAPYLGDSDRAFLKTARIAYAAYDWNLNEQPVTP